MQTYIVNKDFVHGTRVYRVGEELVLSDRQARSLRIAGFIEIKPQAKEVLQVTHIEPVEQVASIASEVTEVEKTEPPKINKKHRFKVD